MANILDYLDWRGDLTMEQSPFNEVDNLILAELSFVDFEGIVPAPGEGKSVPLPDAARAFFDRQGRGPSEISMGMLVPDEIPGMLKKMAACRRFRDMALSCFVNWLDVEKAEQFAALSVEVGDGSLYLSFRGTDDTIAGWKEDFLLSCMPEVHAQKMAVNYVKDAARQFPRRKLLLGGHSKGGNLAVYAAMKSPPAVQDRILRIFSHDGPGFKDKVFETPEFQRISGKIHKTIPQSSLIGMLLENQENYVVVESSRFGFMQHDPFSWTVEEDDFHILRQLAPGSQYLNKTLSDWIDRMSSQKREQFVDALQKETKEALRERPTKATAEYFAQFTVTVDGEKHKITEQEAASIVAYLFDNDYVDEQGNITPEYHQALADGTLQPVSKKLRPMEADIHKLIQGIFDPSALEGMVEDGNKSAEVENSKLNDNASKDEFKALWKDINHRYVYTVHYDSEELIANAVKAIDDELTVTRLRYIVTTGEQGDDELDFNGVRESERNTLSDISTSTVEYDLVGEIARGATLTRRTVVRILKGIQPVKQMMFRNNPEEFIRNVVRIIKEQKATMIIEDISYSRTENTFDSNIFTNDKHKGMIDKAYNAKKCILDYVFCDSDGERKFAQHLDEAKEVCVYARLPRDFRIPTPVGHYAPDWAIAFYDGMGVKHIYFIAETKGAMGSMNLSKIENTKIDCARKLYNIIKVSDARYEQVTDYDTLLDVINDID